MGKYTFYIIIIVLALILIPVIFTYPSFLKQMNQVKKELKKIVI
jgi:hypothetical protein